MPDRQVTIKVSLEGLTDASAQTEKFKTDLQGVGEAAAQAAAPAEALGAAVDKAAVGLEKASAGAKAAEAPVSGITAKFGELTGTLKDKLYPATEAAYNAFEKLSKAETPRAMQRGIMDAEIAFEKFKAAADAAAASGEKMPPRVAQALRLMQGDLDASSLKLGQLRDRMGDVRAKADAMGQGWSQAAASGGSLQGMLNNLESTSTGATQAFTRTALSAVGVAAAFKLGLDAGKHFNSWLVEVRKASGDSGNALAGLAKVIGDTNVLGAGFKKWANEAASATKNFGDELAPVTFKVNAHMKAMQAAGVRFQETTAALKALGVEWHSTGESGALLDKQIEKVTLQLHNAAVKGENLTETARKNAKALEELRLRMEDEGRALDSLDPKTRTAILLADSLAKAHANEVQAKRKLKAAGEEIDKEMVAILSRYREEIEASQKVGAAANAEDLARRHLTESLREYGKAHHLTAGEISEVIEKQSTMLDVMKQTEQDGINVEKAALDKLGGALGEAAAKTETLAQAEAKYQAAVAAGVAMGDEEIAKIKARNAAIDETVAKNEKLAESFGKARDAAASAEDAFGRVADGLARVGATADNATAGLEAVAWEMRKATPASVELTGAQKDLVEQLAKLSDAGGASSLWVGHLLAQFEKGEITLEVFKQKVNQVLQELAKVNGSGVMGNLADELNAINTAIQKFYDKAKSAP